MTQRRGRFPQNRLEIETLPGVGQYVANAIVMFAHGGHEPLLDSGAARVLERHFGPRTRADIRYDPYLQRLAKLIVQSRKAPRLNWALLDLAATVCRIRAPLCAECPLSLTCVDYAARRVAPAAVAGSAERGDGERRRFAQRQQQRGRSSGAEDVPPE
jgi:A/G-specific adenine glycosylase